MNASSSLRKQTSSGLTCPRRWSSPTMSTIRIPLRGTNLTDGEHRRSRPTPRRKADWMRPSQIPALRQKLQILHSAHSLRMTVTCRQHVSRPFLTLPESGTRNSPWNHSRASVDAGRKASTNSSEIPSTPVPSAFALKSIPSHILLQIHSKRRASRIPTPIPIPIPIPLRWPPAPRSSPEPPYSQPLLPTRPLSAHPTIPQSFCLPRRRLSFRNYTHNTTMGK